MLYIHVDSLKPMM